MDYIVDYIVDRKTNREKGLFYLVKWTGKQHYFNSWVPRSTVEEQKNGQKLIDEFLLNVAKNTTISSKRKQLGAIQTRTVCYDNLVIKIGATNMQQPHWILGARAEAILQKAKDQKCYKVLWENGKESDELVEEVKRNQPKLVAMFEAGNPE